MSKRTLPLLVVLLLAVAAYYTYTQMSPTTPEEEEDGDVVEGESIRIAAFNVQVFGRTKREKEDVMGYLALIAREFDVVLIQEIRDASGETAPSYLALINQAEGPAYAYVESPRLGRTTSKEAYAYFYNTESVELIEGSERVYNDTGDVFEREPFIAGFRSGGFDFTLVGIHTKPDDAYNEIGNLTLVVQSILDGDPQEGDVIVLGDFNADGSYFDEGDTGNPLKDPAYFWVLANEVDTMTKTDWTYDRMVMTNATHGWEYVEGSASVLYFDEEYGIEDPELVWAISDHYPIYAEFRTDLADDDLPSP
jgi:endonuclease/exonuclease/phosphatase family metal-dependent hydrolase